MQWALGSSRERAEVGSRLRRAARLAPALLSAAWLGCDAYDSHLLVHRAPVARSDAGRAVVDGGSSAKPDAGMASTMVVDHCTAETELAVCTLEHADGVCIGGKCTIVRCRDNRLDCDRDPANGCEANLDTVENCGACGASCALNHVGNTLCDPDAAGGPCFVDHGCSADATKACTAGAAENGCESGFGDCDGMAANGCETSLKTVTDCGACGKSCGKSGSEVSCATGQCNFVGCADGFADCGSGCISLASDTAHCGGCDSVCPSAAPMCAGGRCTSLSCGKGLADCDGKTSNGCETDLGDPATCGSCDVKCGPYPNASPTCSDGQCGLHCASGFGDCNKRREDGCETDLGRPSSCGACGMDCAALPHVVSAECAASRCAQLKCADGFGDCDGDPTNGCEQALNTSDHCGSCGGTCRPANATGSCQTGTCAISSCSNGYDDCNGMAEDGCEAPLDSDANCGKCKNACPSGTMCQNGGCSCAGGACSDGLECCGGACVDTSGTCVPWPCVPGSTRDKNNCGGCGMACPGWCCFGGI